MGRSAALAGLLAGCAWSASSCAATGIVYTHTTVPLTTDFHQTPAGERVERGDVKSLRYYVRFDWDENAIGAVAKEHGLDEIYYADLETLSILGVWTQRWVHVVGR